MKSGGVFPLARMKSRNSYWDVALGAIIPQGSHSAPSNSMRSGRVIGEQSVNQVVQKEPEVSLAEQNALNKT